MKSYLKFLAIALVCGVLSFMATAIKSDELYLNDIILVTAFGNVEYLPYFFPTFFEAYLPLMFFQFFYGTYIYRHFCTASVYYFSRKCNRSGWFLKEAGSLYIFALLYVLIYLGSEILCCVIFSKVIADISSIFLILYYVVLYSLFLFVTTLAINIFSILFTSNVGLILVEGLVMLCVGAYLMLGKKYITDDELINKYEWMIKVNPFAHLNIKLHSSSLEVINRAINVKNIEFELNTSVVLYLILAVVVTFVGTIIVNKHNFIITNQETGGA